MLANELLQLSATKAAALIRKKKLSPVEYVDAVLARADAVQPKLNCFITMTADLARACLSARTLTQWTNKPNCLPS